jgi:hypothetical protein
MDQPHKRSRTEAVLLVLDAQYTEQENCCPARDEQGAHNVAVLHLARQAMFQNGPAEN